MFDNNDLMDLHQLLSMNVSEVFIVIDELPSNSHVSTSNTVTLFHKTILYVICTKNQIKNQFSVLRYVNIPCSSKTIRPKNSIVILFIYVY